MKSAVTAILVATCAGPLMHSACAQVINGEIVGQQTAGSWSSYVVAHGSDQRFRASTIAGNSVMMVDMLPPTCNAYVQFALPFTTAAQQDVPSTPVDLSLRIDTGDVHTIGGFTNPVAMGDPSYIVYLRTVSDFNALYAEIKNGSSLWMKETLGGGQPLYFNFPLNGFDTAFQRAYQGCVAYTSATKAPSSHKKAARPTKPPISTL